MYNGAAISGTPRMHIEIIEVMKNMAGGEVHWEEALKREIGLLSRQEIEQDASEMGGFGTPATLLNYS